MKRRFKVLLSTLAIGAISLFGVFGASCGAVDWVEEKFDQLTCSHKMTKAVEAKAPTCTEDGHSEYEVCIDCGWEVTKKVVEKARGHQTEVVKGKAATCSEMGLSEGAFCTVCEEVITEQKFTPALGHHKAELKAVAPTCTQTGLTAGIGCDNEGCGMIYVAQEVVETVAHNYYKGICRVCSAFETVPDTSAMREVEVQVGDNIGGGFYRLYMYDTTDKTGLIVVENNDGVGFGLYVGELGAMAFSTGDTEYRLAYAPADSKIIDLGFYFSPLNGSGYVDIYIPANVNEIWKNEDNGDTVNVFVDSNSKLLVYSSDYDELTHVPNGLYKLVP